MRKTFRPGNSAIFTDYGKAEADNLKAAEIKEGESVWERLGIELEFIESLPG